MGALSAVWSVLIYPAAFLFVLGIVVFVHEYGHFIVGRLCGVGIQVFSIGFGRELVGWNDRHGTRWKLAAIPLGGYVKFAGDMNAASVPDNAALAQMSDVEKRRSFQAKPLASRAAIVAAGPAFNFALAIAVFTVLSFVVGSPSRLPIVGGVQPGSAAEQAGFKPDDLILAIDGAAIPTFVDMQKAVSGRAGERLRISVRRDGSEMTLVATPSEREVESDTGPKRIGMLGIQSGREPVGVVTALSNGVRDTWTIVERTVGFIAGLLTGSESPRHLSGPIGIMMVSGEVAATGGFSQLVGLMAILSVSVGLLNLFPIPLLDGGHLVFYACEAVRGRPLSERAQEIGFRIGLAIVVMLMLFATWNDIVNRVSAFTRAGT